MLSGSVGLASGCPSGSAANAGGSTQGRGGVGGEKRLHSSAAAVFANTLYVTCC